MNKYTDEQIIEAIKKAGGKKHPGTVYAWELSMYEQFLDALPEPATDDWQECGFNDFRPTDKRVKAVFAGGSIIEGTPDRRNSEHVFLVDGPVIHSYDDAIFYRIPAPVQHPDPEQYPVIIVRETIVGPLDEPTPMIHDGGNYYESPTGTYCIKTITDWSPAKVVADDE